MNNLLHNIYLEFETPIEGLRRINAMVEFLVSVNESDIADHLSVTSKEGVIVTIELIRKVLDQISETL